MILGILQARMSSTRLPGKVLAPLVGAPMIVRQIERLQRARRLDALVVATSDRPEDDAIAAAVDIPVHRGPLDDVLARFVGALDAFPADHIVRLTADCPLADPEMVDAAIAHHLATGADYTSSTPASHAAPKGLDVEVISAPAFRRAAAAASTPEEHEHVTWGLWNRPDLYRLAWLTSDHADDGDIRWTVDRPDDYAFVREVYEALYPQNPAFTSADIRAFVTARPDLACFGGDRRI